MKNSKLVVALGAVIAALVSSGPVAAQDSGFYLGGALGQSKFKEWCDTGGSPITLTSCGDTDTAWKLLGGYRFGPNFALEGSLIDWGEVSATT
ncbi:MAG TPA: outer membrane beta-barrel protein, partial [Burkholderiales bacterium]|nr:outer membrane beta-barrel protein [Burkholderiales bacterium]